MNASEELQSAYQEWHRLAKAEGEAIRNGNWTLVAECQNALQQLQPRIIRCMEEARQENSRPGIEPNDYLRGLIAELIEIENQNNALLKSVRGAAQAQLGQLEQSGHTLRQVQRSYAPPRPPVWSSFS
jgi:hypothetical protein